MLVGTRLRLINNLTWTVPESGKVCVLRAGIFVEAKQVVPKLILTIPGSMMEIPATFDDVVPLTFSDTAHENGTTKLQNAA